MGRWKAFTIIELMVVVSIIALLIGILLPAIGKARDQAHVTRSQSNLRQIGIAHASYSVEWSDNQWTTVPHNLMSYGSTLVSAISAYNASVSGPQYGITMCSAGVPCLEVGWAYNPVTNQKGVWYWTSAAGDTDMIMPISFKSGFGYFGTWSVNSFNQYVSGRMYDSTFFAPKDRWLITAAGECYDAPGEFCALTATGRIYRPSYRLSASALYSPALFSRDSFTTSDMWNMPALFRVPTYSQARYPDLKTHMMEHRWLQRLRRQCAPEAPEFQTTYEGCFPYFFNAGQESTPVTLFYDGHVSMLSVEEALEADSQAVAAGGPNASLWHTGTPWGTRGYFHDYTYSAAGENPPFGSNTNNTTSFHVLTRHGILGRDTFSR